MRIPRLRGIIDRRILLNYRVDPDVMAAVLPAPFRPHQVAGCAVGGICLIRMKRVRPRMVPGALGFESENAAHRVAVEWEQGGKRFTGVYVPRRDTASRLNALVGGRVFPGKTHLARFHVEEEHPRYHVSVSSSDNKTQMTVRGQTTDVWSPRSIFPTREAASRFFGSGSLGYSATSDVARFDGLKLVCKTWQVEALDVSVAKSSYFEDHARFPPGTTEFDCALLMRGIEHEWVGQQDLCA